MATFPQLKTGAVAQYPVVRRGEYSNQTVRFVDGTDQRYRDSGAPLQSWQVSLGALDETELAAIEEFFLANQGSFGSFAFTDPWDGRVYDDCSLAPDDLSVAALAEMRGTTQLTVVRNR
jgi:phage-related protein